MSSILSIRECLDTVSKTLLMSITVNIRSAWSGFPSIQAFEYMLCHVCE